jgi:hypothetical protein
MNDIGRALRNMGGDCDEKASNMIGNSCPTIIGSLEEKRDRLKQQLSDTEETIQAMKDNPQIERVLNLLAKSGR